MKTKQIKEDQDKGLDEELSTEPKTRARKKANDSLEIDKSKLNHDEPKTSRDLKKSAAKPKVVIRKRPLGIRKTLRNKNVVCKEKPKTTIKKVGRRGRKPAVKTEPENSHNKETVPLIPPSEIKKEPLDEIASSISTSRSSSPKCSGRRQRLSSDMVMMKSVLGDSPSTLVHGPRTSPYTMRSERSNSPSLFEGKNLRSGKPRKVKNLLNEVVMKEQKKRRRLNSDSKTQDGAELGSDCKKIKRGRSCSRDGSEVSKCSDVTESDASLNETLNEAEYKELGKKLDKTKTELDLDTENNLQTSSIEKVPSLSIDSKLSGIKQEAVSSDNIEIKRKKMSLKRSTSLDSDNNNSNRLKLDCLNSTDIKEKLLMKYENNTLLDARDSILTSMSKTFNSKEMAKNMRKARRGRKPAVSGKINSNQTSTKNPVTSTVADMGEDKSETIDTLSKEINDLINNLDQNIDQDNETASDLSNTDKNTEQTEAVNNNLCSFETPVKEKDTILSVSNEITPSKDDDSENIRLHYEEDSQDKVGDIPKHEVTYKCPPSSIDKLMDRLKEFEEFDKKRQRLESESKSNDSKPVMVTSDVVLISKSGGLSFKDIQTVISPEKPIEKEDLLSCFENNSAISIVKRDQVRKSVDLDLPNSVTLIKRNSISRKESTNSNQSKESDAISIFEKSLGKDVTLTEIRKSVEKASPSHTMQRESQHFATLHPNNPTSNLVGVVIDSSQISIVPRLTSEAKIKRNDLQLPKRKSVELFSQNSLECTESNEKMAILEKIKLPPNALISTAISITPAPVTIKSPEQSQVLKAEAVVPPLESITFVPENMWTSENQKVVTDKIIDLEKRPLNDQNTQEIKKGSVISAEEETKSESIKFNDAYLNGENEDLVKDKIRNSEASVEIIELESTEKIDQTLKTEVEDPELFDKINKFDEKDKDDKLSQGENLDQVDNKELQSKELNQNEILDQAVNKEYVDSDQSDKKNESNEFSVQDAKQDGNSNYEDDNVKDSKSEHIALIEKNSYKITDQSPEKLLKPTVTSIEAVPGPSYILDETPESQRRKENILRTLGLLTHKEAKETRLEKLKEKERIYGSSLYKSKTGKSGDYTGTLKTIIKLNRGGERDKKRSCKRSLKMTFQKSKNRSGKPTPELGETNQEDNTYYTIERREAAVSGATSDGGHRKSHYSNRLNSHEMEVIPEPEPTETLNLVIPEKASSFSIHPGRLCMDQCVYCGGKFGLFDTPCHIAQIKSSERQQKILNGEEKLTIDSCLCDACYRHVDRRANCASYRKRPFIKHGINLSAPQQSVDNQDNTHQEKHSISPPLEEESEEEVQDSLSSGRPAICHTEGCLTPGDHSIRRKWLIKMRNSVNKVLHLKGDYPGLHTIPLCAEHHRLLAPLMACVLCRRRSPRNHSLHSNYSFTDLNPLLQGASIPVQFVERPLLCKMCRYYCSLLQKPGTDDGHAKAYRRKLLQIHNIEIPPESENETEGVANPEDSASSKHKKKQRTKSKQRKSSDPEKAVDGESTGKTSESVITEPINGINEEKDIATSSPEKTVDNNIQKHTQPVEEDIESLISSNKIPVPGAVKPQDYQQSDSSEADNVPEVEGPILPLDKQTELQYLLQMQNNPAQFINKTPNFGQNQRSIFKLQNLSIQKPGFQQKNLSKNTKKLHKIGQNLLQKEKVKKESNLETMETAKDPVLKNLPLSDECTIETVPNKKSADINTLKNKWQMSDSFTQVKKNISELSKKLAVEKDVKRTEVKYTNPVKRLETNPSISVRELFPGEEEMNLQCNIEFNNVKDVTPEGWNKHVSTIQCDAETKKLWSELQKPYGNQSSFLRHLILLEKYYRNGDLVLSQNASPHATTYSDSTQSRLKAFDCQNDVPKRTEAPVSLIEFRKKPSVNSKSLLKANQSGDKDLKKSMPPPGMPLKTKKMDKLKPKALPPELIAINAPNTHGRKSIQNVLHNIQQLVKGVSASDPTEVAAGPLPVSVVDPIKEQKEIHKSETHKKKKVTSKPWRPTLMPITPENIEKNRREPHQLAVDGRLLPSLVKVMSSNQPYYITREDYNKMCIMRREKLQQLHEGEVKSKRPSIETETVITEIQPSVVLGNGGTVVQNIITGDKKEIEIAPIGSSAATILKNVGLKNITIAPITAKTATVTSHMTSSAIVSSPSLIVATTPMKLPQLSAVSITSEAVLNPNIQMPIMTTPIISSSPMIMPRIPKSLTVIPQTIVANIPQSAVITTPVPASPAVIQTIEGNRP